MNLNFDPKFKKYISFDIETTGLNPLVNRITCICAKDRDGNVFMLSDMNEGKILKDFYDFILNHHPDIFYFLTKNGKGFDLPFIIFRTMVNVDLGELNMSIKTILSLTSYDHLDLQEITKKRVSLEDLAIILGVDGKLGTGENAIKLWLEGRVEELVKYCMGDVDCNINVFYRYTYLQDVKRLKVGE